LTVLLGFDLPFAGLRKGAILLTLDVVGLGYEVLSAPLAFLPLGVSVDHYESGGAESSSRSASPIMVTAKGMPSLFILKP
jgi:hypothetical protein